MRGEFEDPAAHMNLQSLSLRTSGLLLHPLWSSEGLFER